MVPFDSGHNSFFMKQPRNSALFFDHLAAALKGFSPHFRLPASNIKIMDRRPPMKGPAAFLR
jgi:hypothetical protein